VLLFGHGPNQVGRLKKLVRLLSILWLNNSEQADKYETDVGSRIRTSIAGIGPDSRQRFNTTSSHNSDTESYSFQKLLADVLCTEHKQLS
jgi:hypothetical protein